MNPLGLVSLVTTGVALIIVIISLSTDYWAEGNIQGTPVHHGLWEACMCPSDSCRCSMITGRTPAWFKAIQAAMWLAFLTNLAAFVILGIATFTSIIIPKIMRIGALMAMCCAVFWNVIAIIIFAGEGMDSYLTYYYADVKFGWSWGLSILAGFVEILAIILTILTRSSDDE